MLSKMNRYVSSVATTVWINKKNLRMNIMEYVMLVILFPLTYFVVSLTSSATPHIPVLASGMFVSMFISVFINMQGSLIANSNSIITRELYATYGVKLLDVFDGMSLFHLIMSIPMIVITVVLCVISGNRINYLYLFTWVLLTFAFLASLSVFVGGVVRNPRIATPVMSMCYMIIVLLSPLYYSVSKAHWLILINPFSWLCESFRIALGMESAYNFMLFMLLTIITAIILRICGRRIFDNTRAVEKMTVF